VKILIFDLYPDSFLKTFYKRHSDLDRFKFDEHRAELLSECCAPSYSLYLNRFGCEAEEVITNDARLQTKWAKENGVTCLPLPVVPSKVFNRLFGIDWRFKILKEQVRKKRPDVLFIHERNILTDDFIKELKPYVRLVVCQIASPLPEWRNFKSVDLIVTSMPQFVPLFCDQGIQAEFLAWAFDDRVLNQITTGNGGEDITFIGGIYHGHKSRQDLLERVSQQVPIKWYGYHDRSVKGNSPLMRCYGGELWGLNMYRTLARSMITLNAHIDVAGDYANNQRLFEATGLGVCLLTDWKKNIVDFFDVDREIATYRSEDELVEKLRYLMDHRNERQEMATAGQKRTLRQHTFEKRIQQLLDILKRHI